MDTQPPLQPSIQSQPLLQPSLPSQPLSTIPIPTQATTTTATATTTTWFYFISLMAILIAILYIIIYSLGLANVSSNWAEHRCQPHIMPFASFYGYNTSENFQFCMTSMIKEQAGTSLNPVYQILGTFVGTIGTLIESANSLRLSLATLVGGVTKVFTEFTERINMLMVQIRISVLRMRMLFGRLFSTFYAVMYMGMSGITAATNFGDTFLFKFLDTFCFDPDTLLEVKGKGLIPIKNIIIGDILSLTGSRVTATFNFYSDGQPMVRLGKSRGDSVLVSTNHYIKLSDGTFAHADKHPDATVVAPWSGGTERPLVCLNTDTHQIPVGGYIFLDYDETGEADAPTMIALEKVINGVSSSASKSETVPCPCPNDLDYSPGFLGETNIALQGSVSKMAKNITLGQRISTGIVVGIVKKEVSQFVQIGEDVISASSLVWNDLAQKYERAYTMEGVLNMKNQVAYSFVVSPSATIETRQGTHIRDYMEVMSPDAETLYAKEIAIQFS